MRLEMDENSRYTEPSKAHAWQAAALGVIFFILIYEGVRYVMG